MLILYTFIIKADLGLNDHHQSILHSYIKFSKYQRNQNLKSVDLCFQDILESRLLEPTFTKGEVEEILQSLLNVVRGEVESELIGFAHNNVLLLSQLFSQAEKWHLRMDVNLSEVQNRELLECVKAMEVVDLSNPNERIKLEPIDNTDGTITLMNIELERLQKENERLDEIVKHFEDMMKQLNGQKDKIEKEILEKDNQIDLLKEKTEELFKKLEITESKSTSVENTDSEKILGEYEAVLSEQLTEELDTMRKQVLQVQAQLQLAEEELERKFNQTAVYSNMKKMIVKKNEQVKSLRKRLQELEPNQEMAEVEED